MNEQIQKLAEQAREFANGWFAQDVYRTREDMFNAKFSELIIKECAKFLDENAGYDDCNNSWHPEPEALLKHFGVE